LQKLESYFLGSKVKLMIIGSLYDEEKPSH
jgi:hypothetical protein